jgi:hypothetical protein
MNAAMPDRRPATEEISGVIERVTFHNDDSGFCVLRVKTKGVRGEKGRNNVSSLDIPKWTGSRAARSSLVYIRNADIIWSQTRETIRSTMMRELFSSAPQ